MATNPAEDNGEIATMQQVRGIVRRKLRKREELQEEGLNIYPMMDMMTTLLVFLIMQFSTAASSLQSTEELQLPMSVSTEDVKEAMVLQIATNEIVVDGEHILDLRNGRVDPSEKRDGPNGFLITPLERKLQRIRERAQMIAAANAQRAFEGNVQIVADKRTPYRTLSEVIYTLGQAQFRNLRFVLMKQSAAPPAE